MSSRQLLHPLVREHLLSAIFVDKSRKPSQALSALGSTRKSKPALGAFDATLSCQPNTADHGGLPR